MVENCRIHESWQDFMEYYALTKGSKRLIGFSKFATVHYATPGLYQPGDFLLMGAGDAFAIPLYLFVCQLCVTGT